jgi:threonine synthase
LLALGWIDRMPKLMGVQAEGSAYLYQAWQKGEDVLTKPSIVAQTVADSISAGLPRDRLKAMAAVVETRGAYLTVSDDEILALSRPGRLLSLPNRERGLRRLLKAIEQSPLTNVSWSSTPQRLVMSRSAMAYG